MLLLEFFHPCRDVERPNGREREPAIFAPGEKTAACPRIGPARVIVVDVGGEELDVVRLNGCALSPRRVDFLGGRSKVGCGARAGDAIEESERAAMGRPMNQYAAWLMIRRRAAAAGITAPICNHTFRATGITAYLANGGALEHAQEMAAHESPRTTKLYDRTKERLTQA
jgi:hypothetical protein